MDCGGRGSRVNLGRTVVAGRGAGRWGHTHSVAGSNGEGYIAESKCASEKGVLKDTSKYTRAKAR
jgi:hypothetical protein